VLNIKNVNINRREPRNTRPGTFDLLRFVQLNKQPFIDQLARLDAPAVAPKRAQEIVVKHRPIGRQTQDLHFPKLPMGSDETSYCSPVLITTGVERETLGEPTEIEHLTFQRVVNTVPGNVSLLFHHRRPFCFSPGAGGGADRTPSPS